jgi:hypothetical protein
MKVLPKNKREGRAKITITIDEDIYNKMKQYAEDKSFTQSGCIERAIIYFMQEDPITLTRDKPYPLKPSVIPIRE